jgi:hypothetical protein
MLQISGDKNKCISFISAITKDDKGNTILILYQVNIITHIKNFVTVINLQPLILIQFIPKAYKQLLNSTKTLIWKDDKWKLYNQNATAPTLRGLIELHKPINAIRPIVNWQNRLAKFFSNILQSSAPLAYCFSIKKLHKYYRIFKRFLLTTT